MVSAGEMDDDVIYFLKCMLSNIDCWNYNWEMLCWRRGISFLLGEVLQSRTPMRIQSGPYVFIILRYFMKLRTKVGV